METKAVHRNPGSLNLRVVPIALLAALAALAFGIAPAAAKRHALIGRDGKIHGCYRVKGKPKGMLRVVRARHYRCRRGERKVSWSVVAKSGATGTPGAPGVQGSAGQPGTQSTSETKLVEQIDSLTNRVEGLEGLLAGLTNEGLKEAVGAVPDVEQLCAQTPVLAGQANALQEVIENLGLNSVLTTLGGLLEISGLPTSLNVGEFGCGTP